MKIVFLSALFATVLLSSCSSDDDSTPQVEVPEEVITNVNITLVNDADPTDIVALAHVDVDGIGLGELGTSTVSASLSAGATYTGSFDVVNALADDEEEMNVTAEIAELDDEHQFFFIPTADLNIETTYNDLDEDNYPVGLSFTVEAGDVSTGVLRVVLRHEPNKAAEGVSDGDITNENDGESDFDIDFDLMIADPSA